MVNAKEYHNLITICSQNMAELLEINLLRIVEQSQSVFNQGLLYAGVVATF